MPLTQNGYAASTGSFNRHIIHGQRVNQYFSPKQIIDELMNEKDILHLNQDENILKQANSILVHHTKQYGIVHQIIYKFGHRLAEILYLLHKPTIEQINHRKEWDDTDWNYVKNLKKIYLAGGLLTSSFTNIFQKAIEDFHKDKPDHKEVILLEYSENLALQGLITRASKNALVYDFGQTSVKNGVYINNVLSIKETRPVSIFEGTSEKEYGEHTHRFIFDMISQDLIRNPSINQVEIAISNYVQNGVIEKALWHYGVLFFVESHYQTYLQNSLSKELHRDIVVHLHHDTTAMGYAIKDKKDAVLISLGTAFGITYFDLQDKPL